MSVIEVHLATESKLLPAGLPSLVGRVFFTRTRESVSTSFIYDASYLASRGPNIDPT